LGESGNDNRRHHKTLSHALHRVNAAHAGPYWQRAHRDWRFWAAVAFIAVALFVYVMSDDLAMLPRH
jgi:hypothetical protein